MTEKVNDVQMRKAEVYSDEEAATEIETTTESTAEQWKDIPGYDGAYQVSNPGRVRSVDRHVDIENRTTGHKYQNFFEGRVLSTKVDSKSGLVRAKLSQRSKRTEPHVARLVAEAFVEGWDSGCVVGYKDGDRWNCAADNLTCNPRKLRSGEHPKRYVTARGTGDA